jgi:hypothetical protein
MENNKKILGFYFAALMYDWEFIITDQINKLINSDLYSKTEKLYVRVYYEKKDDLDRFKQIIPDDKKILITYTDTNEFEYGALRIIEDLSRTEDFYCYYFHSKGVSVSEKTFFKYAKIGVTYEELKKNLDSWRIFMEYFLIDKYNLCLEELYNGNDVCGVQLKKTPNTEFFHYSGNFWWSSSDFIKKLPKIDSMDTSNRYHAEFWVGYTNGKLKCLKYCSEAGYRKTIQENYKF